MPFPSPACRHVGAYALSAMLLCLTIGPAEAAQRKVTFYHTDHLGSTTLATDAQGQVVEQIAYTPYGAVSQRTGTINAPQKFTGQRQDTSTGLILFPVRAYDPGLGRFIQPDPTVPNYARPQTLNRYSYALNNPLSRVDPTGYKSFWSKLLSFVLAPLKVTWSILNPGSIPVLWQHASPITYIATSIAILPQVLSGNFPGAIATAAGAYASDKALHTGTGRKIARHVAKEFFDDALGMSPQAARIAAAVVLTAVISFGVEQATMAAINGLPATARPATARELPRQSTEQGQWPYGRTPGNGFKATESFAIENTNGKAFFGSGPLDNVLGKIGFMHVGANTSNAISGRMTRFPWAMYGTYGVCHQMSNLTMSSAGFSNTAIFLVPNWSTTASALSYGNYGGGLIRDAGAAIQAYNDYDE